MTLYEFYGDGCPHCEKMEPVVDKIEEQEDVEIKQLEVWNNEENAEKQEELNDDNCGGVPYFHNTETGDWICGETSEEKLSGWANGEKVEHKEAGLLKKLRKEIF